MKLQFIPPTDPEIQRVLAASMIEDQPALEWLADPAPTAARKACLLNILAVLRVTPTPADPLITLVLDVYTVKVDRVYLAIESRVWRRLGYLVADPALPFYQDPLPPLAIHQELLQSLPMGIPLWVNPATSSALTSFRSETVHGQPSLQMVLAQSPYSYTIADVDLDLENLQDVVSAVGHLKEVLHGKHTGLPTDHLALRAVLATGPAGAYLGLEQMI